MNYSLVKDRGVVVSKLGGSRGGRELGAEVDGLFFFLCKWVSERVWRWGDCFFW